MDQEEKPPSTTSPAPRSPLSDQEAKARLGNLGWEAVRYLRDERRETYNRLESQNRLHLYGLERQEEAERRIAEQVAAGRSALVRAKNRSCRAT